MRPVMLCLVFGIALLNLNCSKDRLYSGSKNPLSTTTDTLMFDTVFTGIGSVTRNFRIKNTQSSPVKITSIVLQGGSQSSFIINVDGSSGTVFKDLILEPDDSLYVFVQIKINPNDINSPFIISDKLIVRVNDQITEVQLEAWGQNAYYHKPFHAIKFKDGSYLPYSLISEQLQAVTASGNRYTLKTDKPHVIYGYLVVDSVEELTVPANVKLYMNYKAGLWVYRYGTLKIEGTLNQPVLIQGARREPEYLGSTGQWDRIWINEGSNQNSIRNAIIKDGFIGVQTDVFGTTLGGPGKLVLENTYIQNMSKYGIQAMGYQIEASNVLVSNCQERLLNIELNGNYRFLHCNFINFWSQSAREEASIRWNNYSEIEKKITVFPLQLYFGNCILDGNKDEELKQDTKSNSELYVQFSNTWIKTLRGSSDGLFSNCVASKTSLEYKNPENYQFKLKTSSNQIRFFNSPSAQSDASKVPFDIEGILRNTQQVTLGVFEDP